MYGNLLTLLRSMEVVPARPEENLLLSMADDILFDVEGAQQPTMSKKFKFEIKKDLNFSSTEMAQANIDDEDLPQEILDAYDEALYDTLPFKSRLLYEKAFDKFLEWLE
ncbi:hypothetical protein QAD02_010206 [Eretmocerus hayati]|uniref:Uncharacterized protein n=1 Tax=Eretmocerus hayati TaxID=131215 RepID=A0ACC2NBM8_9HYME|nr:hypothetical protein QAD02_010206 [Eretmocerus hayati]